MRNHCKSIDELGIDDLVAYVFDASLKLDFALSTEDEQAIFDSYMFGDGHINRYFQRKIEYLEEVKISSWNLLFSSAVKVVFIV